MINRKLSILFITLLLMLGPHSFGQYSKDSLTAQLSKSTGVEKLKILDKLFDISISNNADTGLFYANLLKEEALEMGNEKFEAISYLDFGIYHFYQARFYDAENYVLKAIGLQNKNRDTLSLATSYNILAGIYGESDRYVKSIETLFKALKIHESINRFSGIISTCNNIGLLYSEMSDYDKSLEYYKKALYHANTNKTKYNKGNLYNNIGITYKDLGQYDSALYYYGKSITEYLLENSKMGLASCYLNIGNIYGFQLADQDSAFYYLEMALELSNSLDITATTRIYHSLGRLYAKQNKYAKSIATFNNSLSGANKSQDLNLQMELYFDLYKVNKETGNLFEALENYEQYITIKDSIVNKETKTAIANLEAKFENEKNHIKIEELKAKQKADQRIKLLLWLGITFLILALALSIYVFFQKRKRAGLEKELLKAEKEKLDENLRYKSRQLTSQALQMMQKNKLLGELSKSLTNFSRQIPPESKQELQNLKHQLKRSIRAEEDWDLFKHYFEEVNRDFFPNLLNINARLTPSEQKLSALIKLKFTIKETASLLNISPDSVKTARYNLRKKLGLQKGDNVYDFLNNF